MSTQRLDLEIESTVVATDGPCGEVMRLVIDPGGGRVSALSVLSYEMGAYPVLVPLDRVAAASNGEVRLTMSRAAVADLPLFDPEQHKLPGELDSFAVAQPQAGAGGSVSIRPEPAQPAMAQPVFVLQDGQCVLCSDGDAGRLTLLLADTHGQVQHFVVHTSHPANREVIVPVDWVCEVDRNNVHLSVAYNALWDLPDYRPDREIADEIERVLRDDDLLHSMAYHQTDVAVNAGTVTVRGHVRTSNVKECVESTIRGLRCVLGVDNHLVADDELVNAVTLALSRESRLRVQAYEGFITLTGAVRDVDAMIAAVAAAAGVAQVRGVINRLRASGVSMDAEEQRVLQPTVGQEIFATDGLLGHVERVVINPSNRRVTAIVARGWLPDPQGPDRQTASDAPMRKRDVVIPVNVVRQVTVGGVWLRISGLEAASGKDMKTCCLTVPSAVWQPPYPYSHAEVLLECALH